ncbi:hypothetical protein AAU61_05090 [Desulfocarbo indianensis]|nr:hypothetical protein AAU61_05090 [Desulfocarbo indianensis]
MSKLISTLLFCFLLASLAGVVGAEDRPPASGLRVPEKVDLNGDGKVSLAEHLAWEKGVFTTNDLNGDGYITSREISEREMERVSKLRESGAITMSDEEFAAIVSVQYSLSPALDTDGDGKISLAEHLSFETKNFRNKDLDNDGHVTMEEIILKHRRVAMERAKRMQLKKDLQQSDDQAMKIMQQESNKPQAEKKYQE